MKNSYNYFDMRKDVLFFDYDGVVKEPNYFLLKKIRDELLPFYEGFLATDLIKDFTDDDIKLVVNSIGEDMNLLDKLKIKDFDTKGSYDELFNRYEPMYNLSEMTILGAAIDKLCLASHVNTIYFYSKKEDARITDDISFTFFNKSKLHYVCGDLSTVLEKIEQPTTYFLKDYRTIDIIRQSGKLEYTEIVLMYNGINLDLKNQSLNSNIDIDKLTKEFVKFGMSSII